MGLLKYPLSTVTRCCDLLLSEPFAGSLELSVLMSNGVSTGRLLFVGLLCHQLLGRNTLVAYGVALFRLGDFCALCNGSRGTRSAHAHVIVETVLSMWRARSEAMVADLRRGAFRNIAVALCQRD